MRTKFVSLLILLACTACSTTGTTRITMIGLNDVHGRLLAGDEHGGLVGVSAHVEAVRAVRAQDGGAVLIIDAGDMWQGTLESNLTEGASVVAAYNALGVAAAAIGNHEFDFGPLGPAAIPQTPGDDPREALKQRAREAVFPLLAANLIERESGQPVNWDNVQPSVMVTAGRHDIGIIGVMSLRALSATIAANVSDLEVTPLAPAIIREATALRAAGADLVVVTAHAGGECRHFDAPDDLSSCRMESEIFRVARALPNGLVDHIFAGHVHQGLAHVVNGISITSAFANTVAFSRVDFELDAQSGKRLLRDIHPPQPLTGRTEYEGYTLTPASDVAGIARRAATFADAERNRPLGMTLAAAFTLEGTTESSLGNLFVRALLASLDGDVAMHNVSGGLRAPLPAGPLTYGSVYEMSPFENRVAILSITGAELRAILAAQAKRPGRRVGFAGLRTHVSCESSVLQVDMIRPDGSHILDEDPVRLIVNDYMTLGGDRVLLPIMPEGGFPLDNSLPMTRDVFVDWVSRTGGTIHPDDYRTLDNPNWVGELPVASNCRLP